MKHPFFADYLERLESMQKRLHMEVHDLPVEVMDWQPGPAMSSAAVLLAHITGVLKEGIDIALNLTPSRNRQQEFQMRGVSGVEMLNNLDVIMEYAKKMLPLLDLEDLDKLREDEDGTFTCGWILLHALEHTYLHLGHLQLTCQMWRQRDEMIYS